jgi:hypothetical protein
MTTPTPPGRTTDKARALALGLAGFAAFAWHLRVIAVTTLTDHPAFPVVPSVLTFGFTMAALYLWSRTKD